MNVIKLKKENNALDIALMVDSAAKAERQEYDETAIVDALIREAHCDKAQAKEVAETVTEKLKGANLSVVYICGSGRRSIYTPKSRCRSCRRGKGSYWRKA